MISAMCMGVRGSGGMAESPSPGMSGTHSSKCRESASMLRIQCVHDPDPPCRSSSGSPAPHTRHTIEPSPQGVCSLRDLASMPATIAAEAVSMPALGISEVMAGGLKLRSRGWRGRRA